MHAVRIRLSAVSTLLFFSGACALIYQVAWFRELRLVFGASTAASSAVLAIFMGGLGVGGAMLGRRADASKNPLGMYAKLEIVIACGAALSPLLVVLANGAYLASGGMLRLGLVGATLLRVLLSVVVLGPITFFMGGTLPAAARAVERDGDGARRSVAMLYGANTAGAVAGTVLANFALLEVLGTRMTLWLGALVNVLVGVIAHSWARRARSAVPAPSEADKEPQEPSDVPGRLEEIPRWAPPGAAALAGLAFMLMELTWYRMLAPLLGGSSYTFGLILAVALAGIGIGGALYARTKIPSTLRAFAITCALEALFIALPYAAGDDLAMLALILRPVCRAGFGASIIVWVGLASLVVLPAAIVSGAQFPLIIGLYGGRRHRVGRDVGAAYLANTLGSIVGALAGGFGLIPVLGALGVWKAVVAALVIGSIVAATLDRRLAPNDTPRFVRLLVFSCIPFVLMFARGPSAVWRHSGIGAGRADSRAGNGGPFELAQFRRGEERALRWEADGVESSVANNQQTGYSFVVNGKADGHAIGDAPTQVMSGLLASVIHGAPKQALVIGLGTGSTAGWLGTVPTMERVDVVELEPAILRIARECAPVNQNVMDNPRVHIAIEDARENLRTTGSRYDIIFSEPSNPFRAGISSLYTLEYYRAARERINAGGIFVQWIQAYEVDDWAIATAITTLHQVFPDIEVWSTMPGDLLLVARPEHRPLDVAATRALLSTEPYLSASRSVWQSDGLEMMLAHFVGSSKLTNTVVVQDLGAMNTDDQNFLEFAFAKQVGRRRKSADESFIALSARLGADRPDVVGTYDPVRVQDEIWLLQHAEQTPYSPPLQSGGKSSFGPALLALSSGNFAGALTMLEPFAQDGSTLSQGTRLVMAEAAARGGRVETAAAWIDKGPPREKPFLSAIVAMRRSDWPAATDALVQLFTAARSDPWIHVPDFSEATEMALAIGRKDPALARRLFDVLKEPFAVENERDGRLITRARLSPLVGDPAACLDAFEALEPPPWRKDVLTLRVGCYVKVGSPRAEGAERDLRAFLTVDVPPIGSDLKAAAPSRPADSTAPMSP